MDNIVCGRLTSSSWKEYKNLRLEGLQKDPLAFGGSYESEVKKSENEWKESIEKSHIIGSFIDQKLVGVICFYFNKGTKTNHICNIFGVYLNSDFRNKGVSSILMDKVILLIKEYKITKKIKLTVNTKQTSAIELYKKFGFKTVGKLINELYINEKYYDEVIMELQI